MKKKPDRHEIQIVKYPKCMNCRERMQPNTCGCRYCIMLGYYCKTCRKGVKQYVATDPVVLKRREKETKIKNLIKTFND